MIFVTSDLHLGHDKTFLYHPRGYNTIEEHNNDIITKWNSIVSNDDDVYILGDTMLGDNDAGFDQFCQLNGRIHLVWGNHDTNTRKILFERAPHVIEICGYATVIKYRKYHFYLSHYPTLVENYDNDKPLKSRVINLCGHCHTQDKFKDMTKNCLIYHCELDAHENKPVNIEDIITDIKEYLNEINYTNL